MPKSLTELLNDGELDVIDRINFQPKPDKISVVERIDIEQQSYNPTVWYPRIRTRKFLDFGQIYTTNFKNDNPKHPVRSLKYETSTANPDNVTITLEFRNIVDAALPILLAAKLFKLNNPTGNLPATITVPTTICFSQLSNETDINFIGDHMCPLYLIGAEPCKYGTLYFQHEHRKTIKEFKDLDYQHPLTYAVRLKSQLYKKFSCCVEKNAAAASHVSSEDIVISKHSLRYS